MKFYKRPSIPLELVVELELLGFKVARVRSLILHHEWKTEASRFH